MRFFSLVVICLLAVGCAKKAPPQPQHRYYTHEVAYSGETLGIIAAWYTGTSNNWKEIAAHNPEIKPNRIRIGDVVRIPEVLLTRTEPLPKRAVTSAKKSETPKVGAAEDSSPTPASDAIGAPPAEGAPAADSSAADAAAPPAASPSPEEAAAQKQKTRDDLIDEILKK